MAPQQTDLTNMMHSMSVCVHSGGVITSATEGSQQHSVHADDFLGEQFTDGSTREHHVDTLGHRADCQLTLDGDQHTVRWQQHHFASWAGGASASRRLVVNRGPHWWLVRDFRRESTLTLGLKQTGASPVN